MLIFSLFKLSLKFVNFLVLSFLLGSKYLVFNLLDLELKLVYVVLANKLISVPVNHLERSEPRCTYLRGIVIADGHSLTAVVIILRLFHQLNETEVRVLEHFNLIQILGCQMRIVNVLQCWQTLSTHSWHSC
jgi:hypothetical protein